MARKGSKSSGKIARNLGLAVAAFVLVAALFVALAVIQNLAAALPETDSAVTKRGWIAGLVAAAVLAGVGGILGWTLGGRISSRLVDLALAVSKLGRGGTEVRVRASGDDEIGALGRSLQYLASDLSQLLKEQDQGGGALVSLDPLVKQLRDKVLPQGLAAVAGYEVDGALTAGSRGGLDYFDLVPQQGEGAGAVLYLVSGEGHGALAVYACRLARDELHRALGAGATPRKALAHTNKVMQQALPRGCCAKATLLQIGADGAKLYQAGARAPLWICQRGEVLELAAEGIALGLDAGPVFEKSLQPQEITMSPGTRLVLGNEALHRIDGVLDLLRQHSPRHTAMFMNMLLGSVEQDAGEDGLREDVVLLTAKKAGQP